MELKMVLNGTIRHTSRRQERVCNRLQENIGSNGQAAQSVQSIVPGS